MATTTVTQTPAVEILRLRGEGQPSETAEPVIQENEKQDPDADYKYKRFLPHFDSTLKLPPLTEFEHKDPGLEALKHDNPREFLANATNVEDVRRRWYQEPGYPLRSDADSSNAVSLHPSWVPRSLVSSYTSWTREDVSSWLCSWLSEALW
jgi:hypothetical protein